MPSNESRVVIACAGAGKTTRLVREALQRCGRRVAMVTYTNNNVREITNKFGQQNSGVAAHVDIMTWFEFLLRECARPYQRAKYGKKRIESIRYVNQQSTRYVREIDTERYYFANEELIYSDKIARFVVQCELGSANAISGRLKRIYTDVFIDECQDLAGWDLEVVRMLLQSGLRLTLVGDPRQHIYSTNPAQKNRQHLGTGIVTLIRRWVKQELCRIQYLNASHRCNGEVCEFTNRLWPEMEPMTPRRQRSMKHEGVFLVPSHLIDAYIQAFKPRILRHDKRARADCHDALNFGLSKGLEFERVLILPTGPIRSYLKDGNLKHISKSRDRLYVAVTRAWHSVAFVFDGVSPVVRNRWKP